MTSAKLAALTAALLLGVSVSVAQADVAISNKPTSNMSCVSGVCTATAQKAVLNVADLQALLGIGDVAVRTALLAKDIVVDQPLTWTGTSRLTLDAQQSVIVNKQMTAMGQGSLTITTNDTGDDGKRNKGKKSDGEFVIVPERGSVQLWDKTSSLIIDGQSYTLVYDIKTLAADIAANPSGFYALAKPYDASVDGTYNEPPILAGFQGTMEGLGNIFRNVNMIFTDQEGLAGFFAAVVRGGSVRNLGIAGSLESLDDNNVGLLVANNFGRIEWCWTNGTISAVGDIGGLAGWNDGVIATSYANVRVSRSDLAFAKVGGLVGYNTGRIVSSYAIRSVAFRKANLLSVGGLVGESLGLIENSYARNRVVNGKQTDGDFGGLVGRNDTNATIRSSYAAGEIKKLGEGFLGGLVGDDEASPGTITDNYWDLEKGVSDPNQGAGNKKNDSGITGLTTAQFQSGLPDGFNPKIWGQTPNINNGYPYLLANPPR